MSTPLMQSDRDECASQADVLDHLMIMADHIPRCTPFSYLKPPQKQLIKLGQSQSAVSCRADLRKERLVDLRVHLEIRKPRTPLPAFSFKISRRRASVSSPQSCQRLTPRTSQSPARYKCTLQFVGRECADT